jgi:hypothetical protein
MISASIPSRQTNELPAQKQVARPRRQTSLHEAITRAFEVAQTIDKAVRVATGESLERFMARVMNKFFERSEGTHLRIGMTDNIFKTFGHLQVCDNAPCKGEEWRTENVDYSPYPSGHPVDLSAWVETKDEYEEVCRCMEECGFTPSLPNSNRFGQASCERPFGFANCDLRDRTELDNNTLAKLACLILKNRWGVEEKKEIACFFDHDEVRSDVVLDSGDVLRECLAGVSSREPKNALLWIRSENEEISITMERVMPGTLKIWPVISGGENSLRIRAIFDEAGYTMDAEDDWLGSEETNFIASVFENIFCAIGIPFESNQLRAELRVQRRFV